MSKKERIGHLIFSLITMAVCLVGYGFTIYGVWVLMAERWRVIVELATMTLFTFALYYDILMTTTALRFMRPDPPVLESSYIDNRACLCYLCPTCKHEIARLDTNSAYIPKHCPYCGKALSNKRRPRR